MRLKLFILCLGIAVHGKGIRDKTDDDFPNDLSDLRSDLELILQPDVRPNQKYTISYDNTDEHGTRIFHTEISDERNTRMGTYGYINGKGLFRVVYYLADDGGYHVFVCTNEPGTETSDPADAKIRVSKEWKLSPKAKVNMLFTRVKAVPDIIRKHLDGGRMDSVDMIKKVVSEMMKPSGPTDGVQVDSRERNVPEYKEERPDRRRRRRKRKSE